MSREKPKTYKPNSPGAMRAQYGETLTQLQKEIEVGRLTLDTDAYGNPMRLTSTATRRGLQLRLRLGKTSKPSAYSKNSPKSMRSV